MEATYKAKYLQLKSQYMNAVDTAFRLGFEQGKQQADLDTMNQQQMQNEQMAMQAAGAPTGANPGGGSPDAGSSAEDATSSPEDTNEESQQPAAPMQESEHPDGSELDQHIAKLESLISSFGKSEGNDLEELTKTLNGMKSFRKSQLQAIELKKSAQAINGIAKALHKPGFKLSVQASHNMSDASKRAVTLQHKIVDNIMQKWEEEEMKTLRGINQIISVEGLTKKE